MDRNCTGCGACISICPKQCLVLEEKLNGHFNIKKRKENCIECNKCIQVCSVLKKDYPKVYAASSLDRDILLTSSSGGIAPLLAREIIKMDGVVFGAAFDETFEVHHTAVKKMEDLDKIQGSKYVYSRIEDNYKQAGYELCRGRKVLFTGTGCQIAGLLNYLKIRGIDRSNLYTQDFICHGVVVPSVWRKYLREMKKRYESEIRTISFRDKEYGWNNFGVKIVFENGKKYFEYGNQDLYMKIFLSNICLNENCYQCMYRGTLREADITLADFWSVYRVCPEMYNPDGTSIVIINHLQGEKLFQRAYPMLKIREMNLHDITRTETMLVTTVEDHVNRPLFFQMLSRYSLGDIFEKCNRNKFGIWGSYNARCITKRCGDVIFQIANSSLISLFSDEIPIHNILNKNNKFREEMLHLDFNKNFRKYFEKYLSKIDYLVIDLLEERFGILLLSKGVVTDSDALHDAGIKLDYKRKITMENDIYMEKWKKACRNLIMMFKRTKAVTPIFLINSYLATKKEGNVEYKENAWIEKINNILKKMYFFLFDECQKSGIRIYNIEIPEIFFYTQTNHKYGVYPWHLNSRVELMGKTGINMIIRKINEEKWEEKNV